MIVPKSEQDIQKLAEVGRITAKILRLATAEVKAGSTTKLVDQKVERLVKEFGVKAAFKGYRGYPASICISVNDEVVHGIPDGKRIFRDGDIVSLDFGAVQDGFFSDAALTVAVGEVTEEDRRLIQVTRESLDKGIEKACVGNRLFDISFAIQRHVESNGFSVVRAFVGHGIGRALHEDPQVPNFGSPGCGIRLREGMVLAIEPMVNAGTHDVKVKEDGWTAVTLDGRHSAHFEHCVAITKEGPVRLTVEGDGANA